MNIVYVISSLKKSGPVGVLYNIVKNICSKNIHVTIITIKKIDNDDLVNNFANLSVKCISLNLSWIECIYKGKKSLASVMNDINPDVVHAQCFRSALLVSSIKGLWNSYATIHCYPHIDFSYEYGKLVGMLMTKLYIGALRKIKFPIACSNAISDEMRKMFELDTYVVLNGVSDNKISDIDFAQYKKAPKQKVLLCVAGFNKRKNQKAILKNFFPLLNENKISIVFLGDGEYKRECQKLGIPNTYYLGNVNNVYDYYGKADGVISASIGEGMPMAILEALISGVPKFLLSDIQPHKELKEMFPQEVMLLDFNEEISSKELSSCYEFLDGESDRNKIKKMAREKISAKKMAEEYMNLYQNNIEKCW